MQTTALYTRQPPGSADKGGRRLNVGCGPIQPDSWLNIDNSRRARLRKWAPAIDWLFVRLGILPPTEFRSNTLAFDLVAHWPFSEGTIDAIYGGEVFEHFTQLDGRRFLAECYRVLVPGGTLRLRVPDNYRFWKHYVTEVENCLSLRP